jgi:hypothetical protein
MFMFSKFLIFIIILAVIWYILRYFIASKGYFDSEAFLKKINDKRSKRLK